MNQKNVLVRRGLVFIAFMLTVIGTAAIGWSAEEDYNGVYAGTFSGDDNGVWVAVIDSSSDNIFLSHSTDTGDGDGGYVYFEENENTGNFWGWLMLSGNYSDAYIDPANDTVIGFWDGTSNVSGTLSGKAMTSCSYEGTYSGTLQGDVSGTWSITIQSNGYVSGSMVSDDGANRLVGGCHPDGYVIVFSIDGHGYYFAGSGMFSNDGFSGQWASESDDMGTLSGSTDTDQGGSEGDIENGGGGGCFIGQLLK